MIKLFYVPFDNNSIETTENTIYHRIKFIKKIFHGFLFPKLRIFYFVCSLVLRYKLRIIKNNNQQSTFNYQLSTINYQLSTIN